MSDKPPFIASQRILLLTETDSPRRYLQPSFFRSQRPGASGPAADSGVDSSAWTEIERDQFLGVQPIERCDLRRAVLTTDAGIGKTANLEWLHCQINAAGDGRLALLVPINELAASYDGFLPETLVARFRYLVPGNSATHLKQDDAELILRRLRDAGQIVLLLDALDQTGAASPQIATLCQIIAHPDWRRCRIVVSGRPHALVLHWDRLLEARSVGWRYLQLAEFDAQQQQQYLGQTAGGRPRYESIRHEARDILGTPRVLQYLRKLTDGELAQIRTPSDVYLKSLRHLIVEGMSKDETARKIGLAADAADAPAKVQSHQVDRALKLLAGIAFEMTKWPAPPGAESLPDVQVAAPRPNFDQIAPGDFNGFRDCICGRLPEASTAADLDRLAALNGILQHGFFDSGDSEGLRQILWRNRSLQEFCAAYWLSQFCTVPDVQTLERRLDLRSDQPAPWFYLPDDPLSEEYYWIWRYAAEMPAEGRNSECWPRAMSPLYRPGDGWTARRSNEMIYRSWESMEQHARQSSAAREIMDGFLGEFEQILRGQRRRCEKKRGSGVFGIMAWWIAGFRDAGRRAQQKRAAAEFAASFVPIKAGTFKLGRPKDKPVPPDEEQFQRYRRWFEHRTHEEIVEAIWPQGTYSGPEGAQRRQELQARGRSILSEPNGREQLARDLASPNIDNEVVEVRQQKMQAYQFGRDPVLNRWYRLFDPQHGLRPSWYREDYARYSPAAGTPVIYVSWYDAWVFCRWARWVGVSCHLPSERQWEYAAKTGADDEHYWWGDDFSAEKCNANAAVGRTTVPSDSHCNPWGLRDILGNVWEWCQDWYGEYDLDLPDGPATGSDRVCRGGSWDDGPTGCRSAVRGRFSPEDRCGYLGFRSARSSVGFGPVQSGSGFG